jgi:F-type H+-transporting ATPase subunit a
MFFTINSPLEQFEILPLFLFNFFPLDISITNQTVILFLFLFFLISIVFGLLTKETNVLIVIPSRWQSFFENYYSFISTVVISNIIGEKAQRFFPLIFTLFFFIASLNLIGLVPFSYTVTSQFIVTFSLSLTIFIAINIIGMKIHGLKMFSLFLPSGTPFLLAIVLVPIEFFLYLFRPLSLAIRLFCNMTSSHILLNIFAGLAWGCTGLLFFFIFLPITMSLILFCLDFILTLLQAYVFSLLTCIYLNDAVNLH